MAAPTAVNTAADEAIPKPRCRGPEEGEGGLEAAEGDQGAERHHQQGSDAGTTGQGCDGPGRRPTAGRARGSGPVGLGQAAGGHDGVDGGDPSGQEKGQPGSAERGQRAQGRARPRTRPRTPRPSSPNRRARSAGPARSAAAAWATDTLAPEAPSMIRPTSSTARPPARPVSRLPTAVPANDTSRTGLRPKRSDTRPHSGEHTKLAAEKAATSRVAWKEVV